MPSQKLVLCEVQRTSAEPTTRYIPLEIYGLWEYLMKEKHGFQVTNLGASLWIDVEESPELAYSETAYERVTELSLFVFSDADGMFNRVCRYFPSERYSELKEIFLRHYSQAHEPSEATQHVREREGIWIRRGSPAQAAAGV